MEEMPPLKEHGDDASIDSNAGKEMAFYEWLGLDREGGIDDFDTGQ
jgi:hypothetical protein